MKFNYDQVKQIFSDGGCTLLSTEYKNARTPLDYLCSCGNKSKIVLYSFKAGNRCRKCGSQRTAQKHRYSFEQVKSYFIQSGCTLLETEYIDSQTKMRYICSCGNESLTKFNNFQQGKRCWNCALEKRRGSNNYQWRSDRKQLALEMNFKDRCHKALTSALKYTGEKKTVRTKELLGYTWKELKGYIESHPNWLNVKDSKWHLDHIFPVKAFIDHNITDLKIINALDNLQPLLAEDNCAKSDDYDSEEFQNFINRKKS